MSFYKHEVSRRKKKTIKKLTFHKTSYKADFDRDQVLRIFATNLLPISEIIYAIVANIIRNDYQLTLGWGGMFTTQRWLSWLSIGLLRGRS